MSYDYPVTIQVPGTTTTSALATYLQSDAGQSTLTVSLIAAGHSMCPWSRGMHARFCPHAKEK